MWYEKPAVKCLFWGVVLVLLLVIFYYVRKSATPALAEHAENQPAQGVYSAGATLRVLGQENTVPYLTNDTVYLDQMNTMERRQMELEADKAAAEAVRDQAALQGQNVGGEALNGVDGSKAREWMTAERGDASVSGIMAKSIHPIEKMTATRSPIQMWMVGGDDMTEQQHEEASKNPDLSPNRWTLQLQNQVNTVNTDSIYGRLNEDVLFQRHLANM